MAIVYRCTNIKAVAEDRAKVTFTEYDSEAEAPYTGDETGRTFSADLDMSGTAAAIQARLAGLRNRIKKQIEEADTIEGRLAALQDYLDNYLTNNPSL